MPNLGSVRAAYAALGSGSTPLWVAREAGIFAEEGLEVELALIRGSTHVVEALLADQVQFANIAAPAAVEADLGGADLVVLTGGMNWLVQALVTRPEIGRPEQLRGRTIGIGESGDIQDRVLRIFLKQHRLQLGADVTSRAIESQPDALARMERGEIDGAIFSPPYVYLAAKRGFRVLIDAAEQRIEYQLGGIIARRSYVESHPEVTRAFVRSYVLAVHHAHTHSDFVAGMLRKYSRIEDDDVARQTYAMLDRTFQPAPYPSVKGVQAILDHLAETNPSALGADARNMIDERWVRELDEGGFIRQLYASDERASTA